jgi:hypothetical protein
MPSTNEYFRTSAKFKTWFKNKKTTKYEILFLFEPHFAVWLLIKNYYLQFDREVSITELQDFFSCSYNRMLVLLMDLENCGSIKRKPGLENLMIFISNDKFVFPRRRRITHINSEADELRSKARIHSK